MAHDLHTHTFLGSQRLGLELWLLALPRLHLNMKLLHFSLEQCYADMGNWSCFSGQCPESGPSIEPASFSYLNSISAS